MGEAHSPTRLFMVPAFAYSLRFYCQLAFFTKEKND